MIGEVDPSATELRIGPALSLAPDWYLRQVVDVARDLLGCLIVSTVGDTIVAGVIVETEAYDGEEDPAAHPSFRRNGLVQAMWGPRGSLYVYRAYGVYPCFNVVAGPNSRPSAVLVRAISPAVNLDVMAERTGRTANARVASGPGLTGRALGIDISENGIRLQGKPVWIQPGKQPSAIVAGPRIGITRGTDKRWRFGISRHPSLSKPFGNS